MLFSYAELINDLAVTFQIVFLQIIQVAAPLPDHFQGPLREWWSCLCACWCSVRWLIRPLSRAIWTSGEPVSDGCLRYVLIRPVFCSLSIQPSLLSKAFLKRDKISYFQNVVKHFIHEQQEKTSSGRRFPATTLASAKSLPAGS